LFDFLIAILLSILKKYVASKLERFSDLHISSLMVPCKGMTLFSRIVALVWTSNGTGFDGLTVNDRCRRLRLSPLHLSHLMA
jgi:hypothetical protein